MELDNEAMPGRACPLCGRQIGGKERVCSCGAVLRPASRFPALDYGAALPWIPLVSAAVLLFWVAPQSDPGGRLLKTAAITVIASAVVALLAAEHLRLCHWKYVQGPLADLSPPAWFAFVLVAWPVGFPAFLYVHFHHVLPGRVKTGWIGAGLFALAFLATWGIVSFRNPYGVPRAPRFVPAVASSVPTPAPAEVPISPVPESFSETPTGASEEPLAMPPLPPPETAPAAPPAPATATVPAGQSLAARATAAPQRTPAPPMDVQQPAAKPPAQRAGSRRPGMSSI